MDIESVIIICICDGLMTSYVVLVRCRRP